MFYTRVSERSSRRTTTLWPAILRYQGYLSPAAGRGAHSIRSRVGGPGSSLYNYLIKVLYLLIRHELSSKPTRAPDRPALSSGGDRRGHQWRRRGAAMRSRGQAHAAGRAERFRLRSDQPFYAHHPRRIALPGAWRIGSGTGITARAGTITAGTVAPGASHALSAASQREQPAQRVESACRFVALPAHGRKTTGERFHRNGVETVGAGARLWAPLVVLRLRRRAVRISRAAGRRNG
jgi:hypothetical protein